MQHFATLVVASVALASYWQGASAIRPNFGAQTVNLERLSRMQASQTPQSLIARASPTFPQYTFAQPLDHFVDTGHSFDQRYWISTRHYNPNSTTPVPVIVLDGGESDATERLPYLDTGIVDILTEATGGIGIVLEHRYYGNSVPVQNFTTDSLR